MSKLFAVILLLISTTTLTFAKAHQPSIEEQRLSRIIVRINAVKSFNHTIGAVVNPTSEDIGESGMTKDGMCMIAISGPAMDGIQDDNAIAFVVAHEIGHCELGHFETAPPITQHEHWEHEYEADAYGKFLCDKAGYDIYEGMIVVSESKWGQDHVRDDDSFSHPGLERRLNAAKSGVYTFVDEEEFWNGMSVVCIFSLLIFYFVFFGEKQKYNS